MIDIILPAYFSELFKIFFIFFIIMDPFVSGIYFLSISKDFSDDEKKKAINSSTYIAGATLVIFLLIGPFALNLLGISINSFRIAGGIILLIIAIRYFLGSFLSEGAKNITDKQTAVLVIGVPLITGPGVLTTSIIMSGEHGLLLTFVGAMIALFFVWFFLKIAEKLAKLIGETGMNITSRIMSLFLAAIAIEFIITGITLVFN